MGSSEPGCKDRNSRDDISLKENLAEKDEKAWEKSDIIPRRFDELAPEQDWIPVADVIRTQREETAKAEAEQIKIKPPLDTDSKPVDKKQNERPDAALDEKVMQEDGKNLQTIEENENMKLKKDIQTIEKAENMKLKSLDEDLNETSYEVDNVTKAMMNWVLKPDYFTKKKSANLAKPSQDNSTTVISQSEYKKEVPPLKSATKDSQHHYDRQNIPSEHSDYSSHRHGNTLPPSKYDYDPQYEHHHHYHEPSPDYDQEDLNHEPYSRYMHDSYGSPDLIEDEDFFWQIPEYGDHYHGPHQNYKHSLYHDSRTHYGTKPSRDLDSHYGGHYHGPTPHQHDQYHHPKPHYKQDRHHDTSTYHEGDYHPGFYPGSRYGQYERHSSNYKRDHHHEHDRNYELDFQQPIDMDRTRNYKHQPQGGRRSHKFDYEY